MSALRPQPTPRRLHSRFATPHLTVGHSRRDAHPFPLRLVLLHPPAERGPVAQVHQVPVLRGPVSRLTVVLAPRVGVSIAAPPVPRPGSGRNGPAGPAGRPGTSRFERRIEHLFARTTRVERSELVLPASSHRPSQQAGGAARAAFLQPAPRMVTAPPPTAAPPSPSLTTATTPEPAATPAAWRPPSPAALADGVLREIDRRVVAERERLGRL